MNLHDINGGDTDLLLAFMRAKFYDTWTWWADGDRVYYRTAPDADRLDLGPARELGYWIDRAKQWERKTGRNPNEALRF